MPDLSSPVTLRSGHRLTRYDRGWRAQTPDGHDLGTDQVRMLLRTIALQPGVAEHYDLAEDIPDALHKALVADLRRLDGRGFLWRIVRTRDSLLVLDELDDALVSYRVWAQPGGPRPYVDGSWETRVLDRRVPIEPSVAERADLALRFVVACHNMTLGVALPSEIDPALVPARPWYVTEIDRHDVVHAADGAHLFSWTHPTGVDADDRHVAEDCVVLANAYPPDADRLMKARAAMKQRRRALRRVELGIAEEPPKTQGAETRLTGQTT